MLGWALFFFICAVLAGIAGFGGLAGVFSGVAQILVVVFAALLLLSLVGRALRGQAPPV